MTKNLQIISFCCTWHAFQKKEWNLNQINLHFLPLNTGKSLYFCMKALDSPVKNTELLESLVETHLGVQSSAQ